MSNLNQEYATEKNDHGVHFDLSFIEQMCRGDREQITKMIDVFSKQVSTSIKILQEAITGQDLETIAREAHKIRPAINVFGLQKIAQHLSVIENSAKGGVPLSSFEKKLKEIIDQLQELINKLG